jgi:hypothetical protein
MKKSIRHDDFDKGCTYLYSDKLTGTFHDAKVVDVARTIEWVLKEYNDRKDSKKEPWIVRVEVVFRP